MLRTERGVTLPCLKFAGPNKGPQPTSVIAPIPGNLIRNLIRGGADDSTYDEGKAHGISLGVNLESVNIIMILLPY